jgi:hypothetical protein
MMETATMAVEPGATRDEPPGRADYAGCSDSDNYVGCGQRHHAGPPRARWGDIVLSNAYRKSISCRAIVCLTMGQI